MVKYFVIFVVLTIVSYENTTNFKTPLASCNPILWTSVGQPSCQGAFNIMKLIPLSEKSKINSGKHFAMVDDEDYDNLIKFKWYINKRGYVVRGIYIRETQKTIIVKMHRLILGLTDPNINGDHIDRNRLNNQRSNLRSCTLIQNNFNKSKRKNGSLTSIYKGVSFARRNKKFLLQDGTIKIYEYTFIRATLSFNKKQIHLGYFKTQEEAARAYDRGAIKYFGEFASLNFNKDEYKES